MEVEGASAAKEKGNRVLHSMLEGKGQDLNKSIKLLMCQRVSP